MKRIILLVTTLCSITIFGSVTPKHLSLDLGASYGSVNGFISIPKGGQGGTSSLERPNFKEVGLRRNYMLNIGMELEYEKWSFVGSERFTNFKETKTLKNDLMTHGIQLSKGNEYTMDTPMQIYSFYGKRRFKLSDKLEVSPLVGFDLQRISYTWKARSKKNDILYHDKTKRNSVDDTRGYFNLIAPSFGVALNYKFTEKTRLEVLGKTIIPMGTDWKYYLYGSAKLIHELYSNDNKILNKMDIYLGVESYGTKSRDSQKEMQNHIQIRQTMGTIGLKVNLF